MAKLNCWEFKKCGREPGGHLVHHLGVCPASVEKKLNGLHGGINGGRCCWFLTGTLCNGEVQQSFSMKFKDCLKCDFYAAVKQEEFRRNGLGRANGNGNDYAMSVVPAGLRFDR